MQCDTIGLQDIQQWKVAFKSAWVSAIYFESALQSLQQVNAESSYEFSGSDDNSFPHPQKLAEKLLKDALEAVK